jgi:ABC-2 type transport system permease protein
MRTIRFLLQKEFRQIFRNKALLPMILIAPLLQLWILPLAADYEVKNVNIAVVDHDRSPASRDMLHAIANSGYFRLVDYGASYDAALKQIEKDKADLILEIPPHFESNIVRQGNEKIFIAVNAINGVKAAIGAGYLTRTLQTFNIRLALQWHQMAELMPQPGVQVTSTNWFNPYLNYRFFMVPGILAVLVTLIASYMTALNIVKEKEIGTIEQINVTPIKKYHFILGKLIPFWIIGMIIFTIGLFVIAMGLYGIVSVGNIALLYLFLSLYLIAILGFGLLISTYAATQQQAMSIAFFFIMIFILMSGLFTPIESMPAWAKIIAHLNPVTYFIEVMRMIVLKGSGFKDILPQLSIIALFAVVLNGWAVWNYRKTS